MERADITEILAYTWKRTPDAVLVKPELQYDEVLVQLVGNMKTLTGKAEGERENSNDKDYDKNVKDYSAHVSRVFCLDTI